MIRFDINTVEDARQSVEAVRQTTARIAGCGKFCIFSTLIPDAFLKPICKQIKRGLIQGALDGSLYQKRFHHLDVIGYGSVH